MNWTHRRPFRHQFNYTNGVNKTLINRPKTFREDIYDQPIDAIRLELSDSNNSSRRCPIHNPNRIHPYIKTFSDHQSSIHSLSTIETDFVHQRVSTIHTYPSSSSIVQRQAIINEDDHDNISIEQNIISDPQNEINQPTNIIILQEKEQEDITNQCRTCTMLIEIVDQQAQQIQQYTQQINQQTDLIAKLARRIATVEEDIHPNNTSQQQQQLIDVPIIT